MKEDWYEGVAREWSYFMTNEILKAYQNMKKKYGISFSKLFFHSKEGIVRIIRRKSELNALINFVEKQDEAFIINQFETAYSLYKKLESKLNEIKLDKNNWNEILELCREAWVHNMFCIYFSYSIERTRIKEISERNYDLIAKVRNDICNFKILEIFLKKQKFDISMLSGEEIIEYLTNNILPKNLDGRKEEYLLVMDGKNVEWILKSEILNTLTEYITEVDYTNITELKGAIAFKGKISGRARVILKEEKLFSLEKGEILITLTTNSNYEPYLLKVAAIVADYGGIISHTAILAREMKIPCICDTKYATRIFKNGDLIEVDADNGFVRKIK